MNQGQNPVTSRDHAQIRKIWSPWLRLMHWTLAASVITAFVTREHVDDVHIVAGYIALTVASLRVILGFYLNGFWAFKQFVHGISRTWTYFKSLLSRNEKAYLGHNPLGAWMVVALLLNTILTTATGMLFDTDAFWGEEWLEELHAFLGDLFVPLVLLHLGGVIYTSLRHKESLVKSMITGNKKVTGQEADIQDLES